MCGQKKKKKRAWYTLFAHAWFPHDFWKIYSVTLTSARHDFSCMKDACHLARSVWTATKEQKRYSALHLQKLFMHSSIPAKCLQQATSTIFLKFTDQLEQNNVDHYCQAYIVSDFKTAPMCLAGSITLQ